MRLRTGKTQLVVSADRQSAGLSIRFDPSRPESVLARNAVDDALERAAGRVDRLKTTDETVRASRADVTSIFWCPACWG